MGSKKEMKQIIEEIECPVCCQYLSNNILLCNSGHSICEACKNKCSECPICKGPFLNGRNFVLENILRVLRLPCKNQKFGCPEELLVSEKENHEIRCRYIKVPCPYKCKWNNVLNSLHGHLSEIHNGFGNYRGVSNIYIKCVTLGNEIFKICFMWSAGQSHATWSAQYIGNEKFAGDYIFVLEFKDRTGEGYKMTLSESCIPMCGNDKAFSSKRITIEKKLLVNFIDKDGVISKEAYIIKKINK